MTDANRRKIIDASNQLLSLDWVKGFNSTWIKRGERYCQDDFVELLSAKDSKGYWVISSKVRGSKATPYRCEVSVPLPGWAGVSGTCSCPLGGDCKHVFATLFEIEDFDPDEDDDEYDFDLDDGIDDFDSEKVIVDMLTKLSSGKSGTLQALSKTKSPVTPPVLKYQTRSWLNGLKTDLKAAPIDDGVEFQGIEGVEVGGSGLAYCFFYGGGDKYLEARGGCARMSLVRVRRLKAGGWGNTTRVNLKKADQGEFANDVPYSEVIRVSQMLALPGSDVKQKDFSFDPQGPFWREIVLEILELGGTIWHGQEAQSLGKGERREIEMCWLTSDSGKMQTGFRSTESKNPVAILRVEPPLYICPKECTWGEATLNLPRGFDPLDWISAPLIDHWEAEVVRKEFAEIAAEIEAKQPKTKPKPRSDSGKRKKPSAKKAPENESPGLLPSPPEMVKKIIDGSDVPLTGILTLDVCDITSGYHWGMRHQRRDFDFTKLPIGLVEIRYGECLIKNPFNEEQEVTVSQDDVIYHVTRNEENENVLFGVLEDCGLIPINEFSDYFGQIDESCLSSLVFDSARSNKEMLQSWFSLLSNGNHLIEAAGWKIEIGPDFGYELIEPDEWYTDLDDRGEGNGIDWLAFDYGIEVAGEKISLISALATFLQIQPKGFEVKNLLEADPKQTIPLFLNDTNKIISIPAQQLGRLAASVSELFDIEPSGGNPLTLHPMRAAQVVSGDLDNFSSNQTAKKLRALGKKLADFDGIKKAPPSEKLNAELRPYQQEGLSWLQFLREYQLNGILADDMGLGKTVQTLACLQIEKEKKRQDHPNLVIAPTSVVSNWVAEADKFTPEMKVLLLHGPDRKAHFESIQNYDLVVTSFALLNRDAEHLLKNQFHYVILDEAHLIKNPKSKMARNACNLKSNHRLCLSGTPMENHLGELWSLMHFLMPGFLGGYDVFRRVWQRPIENDGDSSKKDALVRRIAPILLRRTKDKVLDDLPPRTDMLLTVPLERKQTELYESVRAAMDKKVRDALADKGLNRSHIIVLDALLKLRQICCHPQLLKTKTAQSVNQSAKLERFRELIQEQVECGRCVLVFSQFTSMLAILETELNKLEINYVKLTGSTTKRKEVIDIFQSGEVPVFLISLKAGGSGLNLTAADTVIHYDPWWNPAVEEQATARAHRIGQEKPVFVYRLVTEGTIEERILELQERKAELARAVLSGGDGDDAKDPKGIKKLSSEDLESLLAPIG